MRVNEVNVGGGVVRLEVVPTFRGESIPCHVADRVMKDVIARKSRNEVRVRQPWHCEHNVNVTRPCVAPWVSSSTRLTDRHRQELAWRDTNREPDGIDIHVDRPRQENFWSRKQWAEAMAKYRTLEDVARSCDWECREPMKSLKHEVPCRKRCDFVPGCDLKYDWEDDFEVDVDDLLNVFLSLCR